MSKLEISIYLHIAGINAKLIEDCKTKCILTKSNKKINLLINELIKKLEPICKQN